jgi:hypothetical protein
VAKAKIEESKKALKEQKEAEEAAQEAAEKKAAEEKQLKEAVVEVAESEAAAKNVVIEQKKIETQKVEVEKALNKADEVAFKAEAAEKTKIIAEVVKADEQVINEVETKQ